MYLLCQGFFLSASLLVPNRSVCTGVQHSSSIRLCELILNTFVAITTWKNKIKPFMKPFLFAFPHFKTEKYGKSEYFILCLKPVC